MRSSVRVAVIACALVIACAVSVWMRRGGFWTHQDQDCVFVVPDNFRGAISIRTGVRREEANTSAILDVTRLCYLLPQDGDARIFGPGPFDTPTSYTAEFASGRRIPTRDDMRASSDDAKLVVDPLGDVVAFWSLFSESDGRTWCYVGTHQEFLAAASGRHELVPGERLRLTE